MGDYGLATRVLAARFGSTLDLRRVRCSDIGQLSADALLNDYRFRSLSESTAVYGVAGGSVAHSVSPGDAQRRLSRGAPRRGLSAVPGGRAPTISTASRRAIGISGASVTIPLKVSLLEYVDEVYSVARRIGAINTIRVDGGRWIGGNTDAIGFLEPLQERVSLDGLRVVGARRRRRRAGGDRGARLERLLGAAARAQPRAGGRGRGAHAGRGRARGRRSRGAGIC